MAEVQNNRTDNETNAKLAKVANVNRETYRQAKRVLDSNNDDLKQRVLSGKTSINAGYKELTQDYICRRGEVGGSAKKVGLRIKELERLYGIELGGSRRNNCVLKTQEQLAKEMGISIPTLQNYKLLTDMIPELDGFNFKLGDYVDIKTKTIILPYSTACQIVIYSNL